MNDAKRIAMVRKAAGRLESLAAKLDAIENGTTVIGRMRDAMAGPAAQRLDGQRPAGGISDPTGNAALRYGDVALQDLELLDRLIGQVADLVIVCLDIVDRYPPRRSATVAERLVLARENRKLEPGCENCARFRDGNGNPTWSAPRADLLGPTDVGGRLAKPMRLCAWCYAAARDWGRTPSVAELAKHHRGERVPWPKDVERPA